MYQASAQRQRVLIFLPCFTHGGAEKQGALLARYLRDEGCDVEVWGFPSLAASAPLKATLRSWGIMHHELPAWPSLDWNFSKLPMSRWRLAQQYYRWPQQIRTLAATMPARQFDVVVPFTNMPCVASVLMKRRWGARKVVWNHRGGFEGGIDFTEFLVKTILKQRPVFAANTNVGADFLRHTFGLMPDRVHVIRNTFTPDFDEDERAPSSIKRSSSSISLVHVANFFSEKDGETVIRAMGMLKSNAVRCHLHLVGHFPYKNYRKILDEAVGAFQVQDNVTFHGALDRHRIHVLLRQADVGLLSSKSEGMPNSVMEYMYWRLPVIATDIPGIREVVGEGNAGWLFKVGDAAHLSTLIERLSRDEEMRKQLGVANRRRIVEHFGAEKTLPQWKQVIGIK